MPEHVLMPEIEIITDGGRRRRWTAAEKLRIVEETLEAMRSSGQFGRCLLGGPQARLPDPVGPRAGSGDG